MSASVLAISRSVAAICSSSFVRLAMAPSMSSFSLEIWFSTSLRSPAAADFSFFSLSISLWVTARTSSTRPTGSAIANSSSTASSRAVSLRFFWFIRKPSFLIPAGIF